MAASSPPMNGMLPNMATTEVPAKRSKQEEAEDKAARVSRENQLFLIYIFIASIIVASYAFGLLGFSFVWAFILIVLAFLVWWNKVLALTEHFLRQKELVLHRRRAMRHTETTEWLNFIINRWWVFSSNSISDLIKRNLDPILDQVRPSFLESIEMQSFTVGESTPFIKYIQVFENTYDKTGNKTKTGPTSAMSFVSHLSRKLQTLQHYQVVVEADVGLQSDDFSMIFRTRLKMMGMTLDVAVEKLNISGKMQLLLNCDLNTPFPHVSTVTISFIEKPEVWFAVRMMKAVQMMEIPILKSWIHHLVMDGLTDALVDPGKVDLHLASTGPTIQPQTASTDSKAAQGVLTVTIQGEQLKGGNKSSSDKNPRAFLDDVRYCQLRLGEQRQHTQYMNQGSAAWQDCCSFLVDNLKSDKLLVKWKSKVLFSTHTLAQFTVSLANFPFEFQSIQSTVLEEKVSVAQGGGSVKLNLSMEYTVLSPVEEEIQKPGTADPDQPHDVVSGVMYIGIHSAKNLKGLDRGGVSDPYCMVYSNGKKLRTTHYVCRTRNPQWDASMEIMVADYTKTMLSFIVYDWDGNNASEDDFLGSAHLVLTPNELRVAHRNLTLGQNLMLQDQNETNSLGTINVTVVFRPVASLAKSETSSKTQQSPATKTGFISSAMQRLSMKGDKKNSVSEDVASLLAKGQGILELKIIQARNLVAMDSNGFSDPYCSVKVNGERKFTTSVKKKTLNPVWDEFVTLQLPESDQILDLKLYDRDVFTQNDFLGAVSLSLDDLKHSSNSGDMWYKLQGIGSGEVQLAVKVILGETLQIHNEAETAPVVDPDESLTTSTVTLRADKKMNGSASSVTLPSEVKPQLVAASAAPVSVPARPDRSSTTSTVMDQDENDRNSVATSAKPSRKSYFTRGPLRRTSSDNHMKRGSLRKRASTSGTTTLEHGAIPYNYDTSSESISGVSMGVEMFNHVEGNVLHIRGIDANRGLVYCKIRLSQSSHRKRQSLSRGRVITKSLLIDPQSLSPINLSFNLDHGLGISKEAQIIFDVKSSSKKHIATRGYYLQDIFGEEASVTSWLPLVNGVEVKVHLRHSGLPFLPSSPTQRKSFLSSLLHSKKKSF